MKNLIVVIVLLAVKSAFAVPTCNFKTKTVSKKNYHGTLWDSDSTRYQVPVGTCDLADYNTSASQCKKLAIKYDASCFQITNGVDKSVDGALWSRSKSTFTACYVCY